MTLLQIMSDGDGRMLRRIFEPERVAAELAAVGVRYERWPVPAGLDEYSTPDQVLAAYETQVERLRVAGRYLLVDVAAIHPDDTDPGWPDRARAARTKFLAEHVHDEDEVRVFVRGRGCFYLHFGHQVHAVVCEAGDLLSVPRGTRHWFDMGVRPDFTAIRFFQEEDGWIGEFTGSAVATRMPLLDDLLAAV